MKSISVSNEVHKAIMDRKTSELKSADLVIRWMIEQERAVTGASSGPPNVPAKTREMHKNKQRI